MFYKTTIISIFLLVIFTVDAFASGSGTNATEEVVSGGVGLGTTIAVVASWSRSSSILWAIFHGILSWIYVVYFAVTRD